MAIIRRLDTSVVWINGNSYQGMVTDVKLPEIESKLDDDARIGLVGIVPAPVGIQKPEASFTFDAWDAGWAKFFDNVMRRTSVMFRGALTNVDDQTDSVAYVITVTGYPMKSAMGTGKPQEKSEWEVGLHVDYCRQVVNGREELLYNPRINQFAVQGEDMLQSRRAALGLL